jgi:hypothetical protein
MNDKISVYLELANDLDLKGFYNEANNLTKLAQMEMENIEIKPLLKDESQIAEDENDRWWHELSSQEKQQLKDNYSM